MQKQTPDVNIGDLKVTTGRVDSSNPNQSNTPKSGVITIEDLINKCSEMIQYALHNHQFNDAAELTKSLNHLYQIKAFEAQHIMQLSLADICEEIKVLNTRSLANATAISSIESQMSTKVDASILSNFSPMPK